MLSDYHLHSDFSGDCKVPMEEMIQAAIKLNIDRLCFTEHHDLDFPHPKIDFTLDIDKYFEVLKGYQRHYKDNIQILAGIELGMQEHLYPALSNIVSKYPFDFVLASNHLANGLDVYDKIYFENRSQYKGYLEYFEDILKNVTNYTDYDSYGHLDYVIRYGEFPEKKLAYQDFKDVLDAILRQIIQNGKGIEINTSGYRYNLGEPHPSENILRHYKELGGEIITIGSDAHLPKHLMNNFDKGKDLLRKVGFTNFTTFVARKAEFHSLY
jgi:histidinol-phosphatase (PHP family)